MCFAERKSVEFYQFLLTQCAWLPESSKTNVTQNPSWILEPKPFLISYTKIKFPVLPKIFVTLLQSY